MNPRRISYADKQVLLLESSGNMRATIVQMLRQLGVVNIRPMTLSERVLDVVRDEPFDIVLLGHNTRDKITGIQLLEEARYRGYMRPTTGWIFMTSDSSQEIVLHAIDSNPDYLLSKPFSAEELKYRIDSLIARKQVLRPVDVALEAKDALAALRACDEINAQDPCYDLAQRIKARLLIQLGRAQEAFEILESRYWITSDKDTGLVLAEALLALNRLDEAIELLQSLTETWPLLVPALDLLSKAWEQKGELKLAQQALQEATARSPLGIPRQLELGRVATQTRELQVAEGAYKRSIQLGRSSCYRSPEPFLRLANIRRLEMQDAPSGRQIELRNDLDTLLNHAEFTFPKDAELKVRSALLRARVAEDLEDGVEAEQMQRKAEQLNRQLDKPLDLRREGLILSADPVPILEPVAEEPAAVGMPKDQLMSEKMNRLAAQHYLAGKFAQALRYLNMAAEYNSANPYALLNLAQVYLEVARDYSDKRVERLKMVQRFLKLTSRMTLNPEASERLQQLQDWSLQPVESLPKGSLALLLR